LFISRYEKDVLILLIIAINMITCFRSRTGCPLNHKMFSSYFYCENLFRR